MIIIPHQQKNPRAHVSEQMGLFFLFLVFEFFFLLFPSFPADSTLGEIASETRFTTLQSILQQVKEITVGELVANEGLQSGLVADAERVGSARLMQGFIGRCKVVYQEAQRASSPQTRGEEICVVISCARRRISSLINQGRLLSRSTLASIRWRCLSLE